MDHVQNIIDATREIFSSMVMLETTAGIPFERNNEPLVECVTGLISFSGICDGLIAVHMPNQTAIEVTGAFLGMDVDDVDEDVCDAVGELANMVAGNLKAALDPGGKGIDLSMPTVERGEEYNIAAVDGVTDITVPFYLEDGDFRVELQIRQGSAG